MVILVDEVLYEFAATVVQHLTVTSRVNAASYVFECQRYPKDRTRTEDTKYLSSKPLATARPVRNALCWKPSRHSNRPLCSLVICCPLIRSILGLYVSLQLLSLLHKQ